MIGDMTENDNFFILKDSREQFQRRLVEIIRQGGITSSALVQAFQDELGCAFDELANSSEQAGFEEADGLTASRITLMCEADLELEIRIGDISKQLSEKIGNPLWKNCLHFQTLLSRPEMKLEQNPAGPASICRGLWNLCQASDSSLEDRLSLLQRAEACLLEHLPTLYTELNAQFGERGVAQAQRAGVTIKRSASGSGALEINERSRPGSGINSGDMLASLQNALIQQAGVLNPMQPSSGASNGPTNVALNAANMVMLNQLVERLEALNLPAMDINSQEPDEPHAPKILKSNDLGLQQGKPEAIALDTMAYIFEALFDTPELPDAIKMIIGRLQIPLLKQAILDPNLFADTEHPARQLINLVARAAVGLPRDTGRGHPLVVELANVAAHAGEHMESSPEELKATLNTLSKLIEGRDATTQNSVTGFIEALAAQSQEQFVEKAANDWLTETDKQAMPAAIRNFMRMHWVKVMRESYLADSGQGTQWATSKKVFENLLWSVQEKPDADDRKRLATLVPSLLKQIQSGFDQINADAETRKIFMDECFTLQTSALRGNPAAATNALSDNTQHKLSDASSEVAASLFIQTTTSPAGLLKMVRYERPLSAQTTSLSPALTLGNWVRFMLPNEEALCGLLCWVSVDTNTLLLGNPEWGYAVTIPATTLETQLRTGIATVASDLPIFDSAAERALSMIRKN